MRKRLLAIIATVAMVVAMVPSMVFAAGTTIIVNPGDDVAKIIKEAQPGDTIVLKAGNYGKIELDEIDGLWHAENDNEDNSYPNSLHYEWKDVGGGVYSGVYVPDKGVYHKPLADNLTIIGEEGAVVTGFDIYADKGLYGVGYGGVNTSQATKTTLCVAKNLTIKNITFKDDFAIKGAFVAGLTISGCTFADGACINTNHNNNNKRSGVADVIVEDNSFTGSDSDSFPLETRIIISDATNVTIKNNNIEAAEFNGIQLGASVNGEIVIKENYIENAGDRAIRIDKVENAEIAINNNVMVNCGDDEGQLFKVTTMGQGKINLENNYWDGKDIAAAVNTNGGVTLPTKAGIIGGTFDKDVSAYLADGYEQNKSTGEVGVEGSFDQNSGAAKPEDSPNTGDNTAPFAVAGLALAAMGAAVVATRRRTN